MWDHMSQLKNKTEAWPLCSKFLMQQCVCIYDQKGEHIYLKTTHDSSMYDRHHCDCCHKIAISISDIFYFLFDEYLYSD